MNMKKQKGGRGKFMGYGVTVATFICLIDKFIQIYYCLDMNEKEWIYLVIGIWGYSFLAGFYFG